MMIKSKLEKNPKVSVCVVTYNQEKYIRQCLQSIVDQKTDFDFEIVVGDDCSTDGTRAIVQEFAGAYPALVKPIFHSRNIGSTKNYLAVHDAAIGEFIAHIDGDDYALPGKLSVMCKALDSRPDVNIVWHRLRILDERQGKLFDDLMDVKFQPPNGFTRRDLLAYGAAGGHSAKMYRASLRGLLDRSIDEMMDFYVTVEHIAEGRAIWIDEFLGVYRANIGLTTQGNKMRGLLIKHLFYFLKKYPEYRKEINSFSILLLVTDIKNLRNARCSFALWIKSFHLFSVFDFMRRLPVHKILRSPLCN